MKKRVAVVGGGVAGVSAALAASREGAEVTLLESSERVGVSKAHLPFLLSDGWAEDDLVLPEARSLVAVGVDVRTDMAVLSVERRGRNIVVASSSSKGLKRPSEFDSLVICSGATGQVLPMRGLSKPNVFVLGGYSDYLRLSSALEGLNSVVVSGPLPLALRLGEILNARGKEVRIYCGADGLSRQFSAEVARMIKREASARSGTHKVSLVDGQMDSILGVERAEATVSGGHVDTCDGVVVIPRSVPAAPLVDCERGAGGGLLVDTSMSTSLPGVFAAGDSAELRFKSGSVPARLYSMSRTGGEVAGTNAAGGNARASVSWAVEQEFFGVEFCSAGLREEEASAMGLDGDSETSSSTGQGRLFGGDEGGREIVVSIVYDNSTHQIYGMQIAGWRASSFSNTASLIVALGLTVEQIVHVECPFVAGLSTGQSPIALTAGRIAGRKGS
jgi:3-phenylpropionate/trans-cinnamate dioxygenase ferredoxin reductase component